jgi:hypothetical protein
MLYHFGLFNLDEDVDQWKDSVAAAIRRVHGERITGGAPMRYIRNREEHPRQVSLRRSIRICRGCIA